MNLVPLFRLLTSLCILTLLVLPGCMAKNAPSSSPSYGHGGGAANDAAEPMATQADYGTRYDSGGYDAPATSAPPSEPAPMMESESSRSYDSYEEAPAADYDRGAQAAVTPRRHKPGLGTSYGEQHNSHVTTRRFTRGSSRPDVTLALWYNDPAGISAASGRFGQTSHSATANGTFEVAVVDEHGYALSGATVGNKRYVVGEPGQRYRLQVTNNSDFRYEVVASVDGLDVIDGQTAAFEKRGYIIEPWSTIHIDGWRTSNDTIAAFRFSAMEDSYAERKGQGRNIGVVGFAFFHERGGPTWRELHRRHNADPFPGRFAEPPPPRRWR